MKKTKKALASLAIAGMVLSMAPMSVFADTTDDMNRIAGVDRYQTSIKIAERAFTTATTAVIAAGNQENLVDALAAAPLAAQEKAPILLTDKAGMNADVKAELTKLGVKKVFVVGAAASQAVTDELKAAGFEVETLTGTDRTATSAAINAKLTAPAGTFVVGYSAVADAMSAASFAAANNYAIVLANPDGTVAAGQKANYILGGETLVANIEGAERVAGVDRFETNKALLAKLSYEYGTVYVANGTEEHLVDALVASVLAGQTKSPIALTDGMSVKADVASKLTSTSMVVALGGAGVVSDAVRDSVKYVAPATLAVESVSAINLNQIKVSFSQAVDGDTAEMVKNYLVDGDELTEDSDVAVLQSDDKTVLITLASPRDQYEKLTFTVTENIYSEDLLDTVPEFEQEVTFSDVTVPTVKSVTVKGNMELDVTFSEAVDLSSISSYLSDFKVNGSSIVNYGYDRYELSNATDSNYSTTIKLFFNEALPTGSNTLTIPDGTTGSMSDGAGFLVKETEMSFSVTEKTAAPKISEVTGQTNGTVYVTFDTAMSGSKDADYGALNPANYTIDDTAATGASFVSGSGDKKVKLTFASGVVAKGANIIKVNADVEDQWGNVIEDTDDYVSAAFNAVSDVTAPTVLSVRLIDDNVIRVKFSEKVEYTYAANVNNYTLKDSSGDEMTITDVDSVPTAGKDADTFDITTEKAIGANCTLKIENIVDLAADPNEMEAYTASVSGTDKAEPTLKSEIAVASNDNAVDVTFSEAMDVSALTDKANYQYKGDTFKSLPTGTKLEARNSNKTVRITFPDAYVVFGHSATTKYNVTEIRVSNVKDTAGNVLQGVSASSAIVAADSVAGIALKADTFKLYTSGSAVVAEVKFASSLSNVDKNDFVVAGQTPDTASLSGSTVLLKFTTTSKKDAIKAAGLGAVVSTVDEVKGTKNSTGVMVANKASQFVYDDQLAPELVSDNIVVNAADQTVIVPFTETLDGSIAGLYKDDFKFINNANGDVLTVKSVAVDGKNVIYTLDAASFSAGQYVTVKAVADKISIKDLEDANDDQNVYVPSSDDKTGYSVKAASVDFAAATAAVVKAEGSHSQADLDAAILLVNALPAGTVKDSLQARVTAEQAVITAAADAATAAAKLAAADAAVAKAEGSKKQADVDAAQALVDALPTDDQVALQGRIDAVQADIDAAAALDAAIAAVNNAADADAMRIALQSAVLALDLDVVGGTSAVSYNAATSIQKLTVAQAIVDDIVANGAYADKDAIQTAVDAAVDAL